MWNARQVTTNANIDGLAFLESCRNGCINLLMCIFQVVHHSLYHTQTNIDQSLFINKLKEPKFKFSVNHEFFYLVFNIVLESIYKTQIKMVLAKNTINDTQIVH